MAYKRLNKPRYRPPVKPCERCGGQRQAGAKRALKVVGVKTPKTVATCEDCRPFCPQTTPGAEPLKERQCSRKTGHVSLCINPLRKQWRRGTVNIAQQGEIVF